MAGRPLLPLLSVLLAVLVWAVWLLWLDRYVVYTRDGAKLDFNREQHSGGQLAVITFHSLEDRIVKSAYRKYENPCTCPPEFPVCVCGKVADVRKVTRKPVAPSEEELETNPRARSAKLRVIEKL